MTNKKKSLNTSNSKTNEPVIDRRSFVFSTSAALTGTMLFSCVGKFGASPSNISVDGSVKIDYSAKGPVMPDNFMGFSYELAQLMNPKFFSPENTELVSLFKALSPNGVLRLGGNSSESCWLKVDENTTAPKMRSVDTKDEEHWMPRDLFMLPASSIISLAGFLKATGWSLVYGFNFGNSSKEQLAKEAEFIYKHVKDYLLYFQIGNEPDFYPAANNRTRPKDWGFNDYLTEWTACAEEILKEVPTAVFGGPDVGSSSDWIKRFIPEASEKLGKRLVAVSGHYYPMGPPDDPTVNTQRLFKTNKKVGADTKSIVDTASKYNFGYRMTEGNSCFRGGKPGTSDTLASALWGGEYLSILATEGCVGVNLHGGSRNILKAALNNHLPGENVASASESDSKGSFYTPIAGEIDFGFSARPLLHAMFMVNQLTGSEMKRVSVDCQNMDVTAFAGVENKETKLLIFNKELEKSINLKVALPEGVKSGKLWRLTGPSLDSRKGILLAGSEIKPGAKWEPKEIEACTRSESSCVVSVPATSAVIIFFD
ncbi:MAG: glycosyl hydrolase family 79 C-terminal domain-containing protein [Croceivirga sp.]